MTDPAQNNPDYTDNPTRVPRLTPDEAVVYQGLGAEEQVKADLPEVVEGPNTLQKPKDRVMTGAIDAAQAAEQAAALGGADETVPRGEDGKPI